MKMAQTDREYNKALGMLFTGNKIKVKRSMSLLSTGTSIFYDNLLAEEVKENGKKNIRNEKKSKKEKYDSCIQEIEANEDLNISLIKKPPVLRFLWAESEPVVSSGILDRLTAYERTLQEAKFEIITTEVTYLNSLNELISRFVKNSELTVCCTQEQWDVLFGSISIVKAASELVLSDLLQQWHENILLTNIYTVLRQHAISILRVYIEYCRKQAHAQALLSELRGNMSWSKALQKIEQESATNNTLQSYLALPMQRVTRLPLLLEVVESKLQKGTNEFTACKLAKSALRKLAQDCNESVGTREENPISLLINKQWTPSVKKNSNTNKDSLWMSTKSWEV